MAKEVVEAWRQGLELEEGRQQQQLDVGGLTWRPQQPLPTEVRVPGLTVVPRVRTAPKGPAPPRSPNAPATPSLAAKARPAARAAAVGQQPKRAAYVFVVGEGFPAAAPAHSAWLLSADPLPLTGMVDDDGRILHPDVGSAAVWAELARGQGDLGGEGPAGEAWLLEAMAERLAPHLFGADPPTNDPKGPVVSRATIRDLAATRAVLVAARAALAGGRVARYEESWYDVAVPRSNLGTITSLRDEAFGALVPHGGSGVVVEVLLPVAPSLACEILQRGYYTAMKGFVTATVCTSRAAFFRAPVGALRSETLDNAPDPNANPPLRSRITKVAVLSAYVRLDPAEARQDTASVKVDALSPRRILVVT
jgi:hypothetical protein